MEQSPSWEANRSSATQEIPRILWNPKVHYRAHNSSPAVPILSQIDPVHATHLASRKPILILFSHLRLGVPSGSFPQVSPPKPCTHLFSPHTCYMPCPSQFSSLAHPNDIWWSTQSIKLLVMYPSPLPCYLVPLRPKYPPKQPVFENP